MVESGRVGLTLVEPIGFGAQVHSADCLFILVRQAYT